VDRLDSEGATPLALAMMAQKALRDSEPGALRSDEPEAARKLPATAGGGVGGDGDKGAVEMAPRRAPRPPSRRSLLGSSNSVESINSTPVVDEEDADAAAKGAAADADADGESAECAAGAGAGHADALCARALAATLPLSFSQSESAADAKDASLSAAINILLNSNASIETATEACGKDLNDIVAVERSWRSIEARGARRVARRAQRR
jgi:hypothetical protein